MKTPASRDGERERERRLALAHALRTPLTSLALGVGLLDRGVVGTLGAAEREIVDALVRDVERLRVLVDASLDTDRLGAYAGPSKTGPSIEREPLDFAELVEHALRPIALQAAPRGISLRASLEAGLRVAADRARLSWVVASLGGNALRFSPDRATITVRLTRGARGVSLSIGDRGPGVSKEIREKLFDRGATSFMLPLAAEIVRAHGGEIGVRSSPGRGTVFTVRLPVAEGSDLALRSKP